MCGLAKLSRKPFRANEAQAVSPRSPFHITAVPVSLTREGSRFCINPSFIKEKRSNSTSHIDDVCRRTSTESVRSRIRREKGIGTPLGELTALLYACVLKHRELDGVWPTSVGETQ